MSDKTTPKDRTTGKLRSTVAASIVGAGAAAAGGGGPEFAVAAAAAAPVLTEATKQVLQKFKDFAENRLQRRLEEVATSAEESSSQPFGELIEACTKDERKGELAERIFHATQRAISKKKLRALGKALASGVLAEESRRIDDLELMVRAIEDLEAPHILVLEVLFRKGMYRGVPDHELAQMLPHGVTIMYAILQTLNRHGLAGPLEPVRTRGARDPDERREWTIWDFGVHLMKHLFDEGGQDA